jgi:hypothetical protein
MDSGIALTVTGLSVGRGGMEQISREVLGREEKRKAMEIEWETQRGSSDPTN